MAGFLKNSEVLVVCQTKRRPPISLWPFIFGQPRVFYRLLSPFPSCGRFFSITEFPSVFFYLFSNGPWPTADSARVRPLLDISVYRWRDRQLDSEDIRKCSCVRVFALEAFQGMLPLIVCHFGWGWQFFWRARYTFCGKWVSHSGSIKQEKQTGQIFKSRAKVGVQLLEKLLLIFIVLLPHYLPFPLWLSVHVIWCG